MQAWYCVRDTSAPWTNIKNEDAFHGHKVSAVDNMSQHLRKNFSDF